MYNRFKDWAREQCDEPEPNWTPETVVAEALVFFDKKTEYDALMKEYSRLASLHEARRRVKSKFNGTLVGEWTGWNNLEVKKVMDKVRETMGGEAAMDKISLEEIRGAVEQASMQLRNCTADHQRLEDMTKEKNKTDLKLAT